MKELVKNKDKNIIQSNQEKLDLLLNIIDSIEINNNNILVRTSKNIAIYNDGNTIHINSGQHVMLSNTIHLNPNIQLNKNDLFNKEQIHKKLNDAEEEAIYYIKNPEEEYKCMKHSKRIEGLK